MGGVGRVSSLRIHWSIEAPQAFGSSERHLRILCADGQNRMKSAMCRWQIPLWLVTASDLRLSSSAAELSSTVYLGRGACNLAITLPHGAKFMNKRWHPHLQKQESRRAQRIGPLQLELAVHEAALKILRTRLRNSSPAQQRRARCSEPWVSAGSLLAVWILLSSWSSVSSRAILCSRPVPSLQNGQYVKRVCSHR